MAQAYLREGGKRDCLLVFFSFFSPLAITFVSKGSLLAFSLPTFFLLFLAFSFCKKRVWTRSLLFFFSITLFGVHAFFFYWFLVPAPFPAAFLFLILFFGFYLLLKKNLLFPPLLVFFWSLLIPLFLFNFGFFLSFFLGTILFFLLKRGQFFLPLSWQRIPPFLGAFVFLNYAFALFFSFYLGKLPPFLRKALVSQREIALLPFRFSGSKPRFALESCKRDYLFVGARGKRGLFLWNQKKGEIVKSFSYGSVGDIVYLDCELKQLFFPSHTTKEILAIDLVHPERKPWIYPLRGGWQPMWVSLSQDKKYLFAVDDANHFFVFERATRKLLRKKTFSGLTLGYPVLLRNRRALFTTKRGFFAYDFLQDRMELLFPWKLYKEMHLKLFFDAHREIVYGISDVSGWIYEFDLHQGKVRRRKKISPFIRYGAYDEEKRMLFLADHVFGRLYFFDVANFQVRKKVFVGSRSHALFLSQDKKKLYLASNAGVVMVSF